MKSPDKSEDSGLAQRFSTSTALRFSLLLMTAFQLSPLQASDLNDFASPMPASSLHEDANESNTDRMPRASREDIYASSQALWSNLKAFAYEQCTSISIKGSVNRLLHPDNGGVFGVWSLPSLNSEPTRRLLLNAETFFKPLDESIISAPKATVFGSTTLKCLNTKSLIASSFGFYFYRTTLYNAARENTCTESERNFGDHASLMFAALTKGKGSTSLGLTAELSDRYWFIQVLTGPIGFITVENYKLDFSFSEKANTVKIPVKPSFAIGMNWLYLKGFNALSVRPFFNFSVNEEFLDALKSLDWKTCSERVAVNFVLQFNFMLGIFSIRFPEWSAGAVNTESTQSKGFQYRLSYGLMVNKPKLFSKHWSVRDAARVDSGLASSSTSAFFL